MDSHLIDLRETQCPHEHLLPSDSQMKSSWTLIDEECDEDDDECVPDMYYISGMRLVNRLGFLITSEPITEEFEVKIEW